MVPVYFLLLICSITCASGIDSLTEARLLSSDANANAIASHDALDEASARLSEITASNALKLASVLPNSRRFNLVLTKSSARLNDNPSELNSDSRAYKVSREDADALSELNESRRVLSLKNLSQRRFKNIPAELSRTDDLESALGATRGSADGERLTPYYRALLNLANSWSRNAQDDSEISEESADKRDGISITAESPNHASNIETAAQLTERALNEAKARLSNLLLEATSDAARRAAKGRTSSQISNSAVRANENKQNRRLFDGNAHYNNLLRDAINNIALVTNSNLKNRRSSASKPTLDAEILHHLSALNNLNVKLNQQQQLDHNEGSLTDNTSGLRSGNSGANAYERALNEAIEKIASIKDANRRAWESFGLRRSLDSGLNTRNSQGDSADLSLLGKRQGGSSDASSRKSCSDEEGNREAEDDTQRSNQASADSNIKAEQRQG